LDFSFQSRLKRGDVGDVGTLDFVTAKENVVFLGRGTGKTHLAIGLGIRADSWAGERREPGEPGSRRVRR
jgi:DNA replication protein DnaC